MPARFLPVGYADVYGRIRSRGEAEQDVLFIGTPYHSRLRLLEQAAQRARVEDWRLRVIGPFWERRYPWKRLSLRLRYPALYPCVENRTVSPREAAELYAASRICLNLHREDASGCNPRTYEILAAGGFELLDVRADYDILRPGQDLDTFRDEAELLAKIRYYLSHEGQRAALARCGQEAVLETRSMREMLRRLLA